MNMVFKDNPYLFSLHLPQMQQDERIITKHAVDQFNQKMDNSKGYNVHLDKTPELSRLWRVFIGICNTYFTNLTLKENDVKYSEVWAYVQNKERYSSIWHNHITSASINAVYYPNVPDPTGTLSIILNSGEEAEVPIKQGYIYLFPGWLIHKPNPQKNSYEPRVSINLELLTTTRPIISKEITSLIHPLYQEIMW